MTIRVVVVDDDALVRSGLAVILDAEPDLDVVGQGADGADVPDLVARTRPDVVLMDVRMPRVDGISATRTLVARSGPPVLVLTTFESDDAVYDALLAGARGFLLKRVPPEELTDAVRTLANTDSVLFPAAISRLVGGRQAAAADDAWVARLTDRERDVLATVCRGRTNAEVASDLFVSVETVKTHVRALLAKAGARHRTELVVRAFESGVSPDRAAGSD